MSPELTPRLADAKRALDAADRVTADGQTMIAEGHEMIKQGKERQRAADPQYWTAAKLIFTELSGSPITQQEAASLLGRSRSMVSKLYTIGKTFHTRDPLAEGLSFAGAYKQAQEVSDYGIGREKIVAALDDDALTQADLEARTGLAHSTVSEYLKQMITDGALQKGPGRPARYERAIVSEVPAEHPTESHRDDRREHPRDDGSTGQRDGQADDHQAGQPGPEPQIEDIAGRHAQDVEEIIRFVERRIRREITGKRLTLTPTEARQLTEELAGSIAAIRDGSQITMLPREQWPDTEAVDPALAKLAKELRWANTSGQQTYFTDGGTVWLIIASTRAAIVRTAGSKITLYPSDVTAGWLLTKATGSTR